MSNRLFRLNPPFLRAFGFCVASLFISALSIGAQTSQIDRVLKQLEEVQPFSGVVISPDARWVAWSQSSQGSNRIYLFDWKKTSATPSLLDQENKKEATEESGLAWSPDSTQAAFLSSSGSSQKQVFVLSIATGKVRKVTRANGYLSDLHWSPDGKTIAFLYAEGGGGGGPLEAVPAQTGVIGTEIHNQRVTTVDVASGEMHQVSPQDLNIYEYDWSPDGKRCAAIAAPGPADNNWWLAKLYVLDMSSGQMQVRYQPPADQQLALPRWSPNGSEIGFISGLMSDAGFTGGEIMVVAGNTGKVRNLTPGRKSSPSSFAWQNDNKLIFTEAVDGGGAISTLDLATGQTELLWRGEENVHEAGNYPNFSLAKDGRTSALIRSTWDKAPEIWAGPVGNWTALTRENASQRPHWGKTESVIWNNQGLRVQGWLLYPENFDPGKRYPMIVEIHGGPAGVQSPSWPTSRFDMSVMAGMGYFVFFPNARGSYGEGEAFTKANVKDFGGGDLSDVLAGVDAVLKKVPVDPDRIGVTGWSYGGFMTMWTVTQTNRFRAAVAGAGIANWLSYYGENSIDEWMKPYFGASVYDDPAAYAKSSPINFIKQVKTPTLVVVGERDGECPAPQSFEFWHALKTIGVPTQLIVYAGEGHSFHEPKDRLDVLRRTLAWFDEHLRAGTEAVH